MRIFNKIIGIIFSLLFCFIQSPAYAQSGYYIKVPVPGSEGFDSWQPPVGVMHYDDNYINTYGPEGNIYAPNGRYYAKKNEPFLFNANEHLVISGYEVTHMGFYVNTAMDEGLFYDSAEGSIGGGIHKHRHTLHRHHALDMYAL